MILCIDIAAPPMISAKEIKDISEIIDILRPIEAATKQLCGQNFNNQYGYSHDLQCRFYMMTKNIYQFNPTEQIGAHCSA